MNDYKKVTDRIEPGERCREEVLNMRSAKNRKNIKVKSKGRLVALISAATVAACGGTAALAAELGAFDKLTNKQERTITLDNGVETPIDKYDHNDYEKIAANSVKFEEVSSASNEYMSAALDSVYCDGQELIVGFTGEMADGNPEGLSTLRFTAIVEVNGERITTDRIDGSYLPYYGGAFVIDEGTANSFTGSMTCMLPASARFTDTADVTIKINHIWSNEKDYYDEAAQRSYSYEIMPEDAEKLTFASSVTADTSLLKQINKTVEQDGFYITVYSISPAMMLVDYGYPEAYDIAMDEEIENGTDDGYCHAVHPVAALFDEDGNYIDWLDMDSVLMEDGTWLSAYQSTDSKTITIKFGDKNCESNELGTVEFDNIYGHYSFGYITELTIDISEGE